VGTLSSLGNAEKTVDFRRRFAYNGIRVKTDNEGVRVTYTPGDTSEVTD